MILVAILSIFIMIAFAAKIGDFVNNHPSIKILALSFLLMIGTLLVAESFSLRNSKRIRLFCNGFHFHRRVNKYAT